MPAIFRAESRKRVRGSVILVAVFGVLSTLYFSIFPEMADDAEAIADAFPQAFLDFFGVEQMHTIEGFIAAEVYSFFWVVLLGVYFAYVSAGMIAGDVQSRRMDLTLSNPVSRESVVLQKVASLWVPLVVVNVAVALIVYVGSALIGYAMNPVAIGMLHLLSVPYLLVCAGIGLVLSVTLDRVRTARSMAFGLVFVLWLVEGASQLDPDYEWVGTLAPNRYYDETAIIVREEYAFADAAVLLTVFVVLVAVATVVFTRRDI